MAELTFDRAGYVDLLRKLIGENRCVFRVRSYTEHTQGVSSELEVVLSLSLLHTHTHTSCAHLHRKFHQS